MYCIDFSADSFFRTWNAIAIQYKFLPIRPTVKTICPEKYDGYILWLSNRIVLPR